MQRLEGKVLTVELLQDALHSAGAAAARHLHVEGVLVLGHGGWGSRRGEAEKGRSSERSESRYERKCGRSLACLESSKETKSRLRGDGKEDGRR